MGLVTIRLDQTPGPTRRIGDLVVALRPLSADVPWMEAWRTLAAAPAFDNLFYDPDFAIPAAGPFGRGVHVMLVGDRPPEEAGLKLLALWPLQVTRTRWGVPIPLALGWMHPFGIFGVPLLDSADPARAFTALFEGLRSVGLRRAMLTHVPTEGPFADLLAQWARTARARRAPFWAHARAFLDLTAKTSSERASYLGHLSARRRRRLRQSRERLEMQAPLLFETARGPDAVSSALDDFIALEGRGWKGEAGTALARQPAEAAFVAAAARAFAARGDMRVDRLARDGQSLASALTFVTRGQAWCLKIAFDEAAARDSPGALHLHHLTRSLLDDSRISSADSCAPPDFFLAETFWAERLPLAHILVETAAGDPLYPFAARLEGFRASAVRRLKRWRAGRAAAAKDADRKDAD